MPRFVPSTDNVERTTLWIDVRLSRDEYEAIKRLAMKTGDTVHEWIGGKVGLAIDVAVNSESSDI
jgi:hypothetical protein